VEEKGGESRKKDNQTTEKKGGRIWLSFLSLTLFPSRSGKGKKLKKKKRGVGGGERKRRGATGKEN